ncbi:MAG: radical SAM protein [Elusimicrobiota bacterium]|jgi:MoaA/NifB/PqqE/SkfB family radical SAM enzyme
MALHLPVTRACDSRCAFCSAHGRGPGDYRLSLLLRLIDEDPGDHVQVSGGEPFLRRSADLLRILARCRERGKVAELQTNGLHLLEPSTTRLKALAGLTSFFNVNFSAHTPALDLRVTGVRGGFRRRLEGVRRLLALGAKVRLTHVLCGPNFRHAPAFVEFVRRELPGVSWIQFSFVKGIGRAKGKSRLIPRYGEAAPYLRRALAACRRGGLRFEVDHIPVCYVREYREHHVDYRKMREGLSGVHLSEKQKTADCAGCRLRARCPGPRVDYIEVHRSL